jgi:hypothetical protein
MILLKDFLEKEIIGAASAQIRSNIAIKRFSSFLPQLPNNDWGMVLSVFALKSPWTYWDSNVVDEALKILEIDVERTTKAFNFRSNDFGIAIDNLFRLSSALIYEESLDTDKSRELLRLATEFHPEYLRHNEHIFGNLLSIYWSVLKKKSVEGKFDIRGAVALIKRENHQTILLGYNDNIRNAIAHGQVIFKGLGSIQYGDENANYSISSSEFLRTFDNLWRTCNSLTIAILLFMARNEEKIKDNGIILPPSLISFIASAIVERKSLSVNGAIESETFLAGKQLHIFLKTSYLRREWILFECLRISALLLKHGANSYERFIFDIDQSGRVPSHVMVKANFLSNLLDTPNTPLEKMNEALDESPLLWFNESNFSHRIRSMKEIFSSIFKLHWNNLENQWEQQGLRVSNQSYRIIKIKNQSTSGIRRLHVYAVLKNQDFKDDRNFIKRVIKKIIRQTSRAIIRDDSDFSKKFSFSGFPTYVWVSLYQKDGTFRWVTSEGWLGGNLIAQGEKIFGYFKAPVFVPNPEEIWKGIRFRFSLDSPAYTGAMTNLVNILTEVGQEKQGNSSD